MNPPGRRNLSAEDFSSERLDHYRGSGNSLPGLGNAEPDWRSVHRDEDGKAYPHKFQRNQTLDAFDGIRFRGSGSADCYKEHWLADPANKPLICPLPAGHLFKVQSTSLPEAIK